MPGELSQYGFERVVGHAAGDRRVGRVLFRQLGPDLARVDRLRADAAARLQLQTAADPRADAQLEAVVDGGDRPVVRGQVDQVVGLPEQRRVDVVESADRIAAATGQPGVGRRDDAELREVAGPDDEVVGHVEVLQPAADVADFDRDARQQLLLHRRADLPVARPHAPALEHPGIDARHRRRLAERRLIDRAAEIAAGCAAVLRRDVRQVAVRR